MVEDSRTPAPATGAGRDPAEASKRQAFEEEAIPCLDAVHRFALRLSGDPDRAEDLVQDTFHRAYRSWHRYTPGTRCRSWLFTICRNLYVRRWKRRRRRRTLLAEKAEEDPRSLSPERPVFAGNWNPDPERAFFDGLVDAEAVEAIDSLPEIYRTAVVLSDLEGLSYREVAQVLDIPVGTVKSRVFRGRRELREKLRSYAVEMGYTEPREVRGAGVEG